MRHILRRTVTRDRRGRILDTNVERLSDDGRGRLNLSVQRTAIWCTGCHRPVQDLDELRGRCDLCRSRGLCVRCETRCQACSRSLCGRCRRGFTGQTVMTVCPICLHRLHLRQHYIDRLNVRQQAAQRRSLLHREWLQAQQLRLQLARMRLQGRLAARRERNRIMLALTRHRNARWFIR